MEPGERTGTTVTYWASEEIFETTTYSFETITTRFREYAFLNKGLEIVVRDERPAAEEVLEAVQDDTIADEVDQAGADAIRKGESGGLSSGSSSTTAAWSTTSSTSTGASRSPTPR